MTILTQWCKVLRLQTPNIFLENKEIKTKYATRMVWDAGNETSRDAITIYDKIFEICM